VTSEVEERPRLVTGDTGVNGLIAKRASDVITQTSSGQQNGMVEDLTLFQASKCS